MLADTLHLGYFWFLLGFLAWLASRILHQSWLNCVAIAALFTAMAMALVVLPIVAQAVVFTSLTLLTLALYLRYFYVPTPALATQKMAKRARQLVGHRVSLMRSVKLGKSKIQAANAVWPVRCEQGLPAGTLVEVTGVEGLELEVKLAGGGKA